MTTEQRVECPFYRTYSSTNDRSAIREIWIHKATQSEKIATLYLCQHQQTQFHIPLLPVPTSLVYSLRHDPELCCSQPPFPPSTQTNNNKFIHPSIHPLFNCQQYSILDISCVSYIHSNTSKLMLLTYIMLQPFTEAYLTLKSC